MVLALSVACGKSNVEPGAAAPASVPAATPLPPGVTQNLTKSAVAPLGFIDNIGPVGDPAKQKVVQVSGDAALAITGWAVDEPKKAPAGGVDLVIDGVPYSAHYGTERTDVATHFKRPAYANSGFELRMAAGQINKGPHAVSMRVISSNRKSYYEGPVIPFTVN